jgi:hypothetical protein
MIVALPVFFYFQAKSGFGGFNQDLKAAWWLVAYLPIMAILSLIGSKQFGGLGVLPYGWDMLVVIVFSLIFYYWGACIRAIARNISTSASRFTAAKRPNMRRAACRATSGCQRASALKTEVP